MNNQYLHIGQDKEKFNVEPRKTSVRVKLFILIILIGLFSIIHVSNVIQVKALLKEIQELEKQKINLHNNNLMLKFSVNQLESPDRITSIATEWFGMVKPEKPPKSLK